MMTMAAVARAKHTARCRGALLVLAICLGVLVLLCVAVDCLALALLGGRGLLLVFLRHGDYNM